MSKVTSKLQVTLPKAIAERYKVRPGDEIEWVPAGEVIRVIPVKGQAESDDRESRLRLFDQATARYAKRAAPKGRHRDRGWKREDLYHRGRSH